MLDPMDKSEITVSNGAEPSSELSGSIVYGLVGSIEHARKCKNELGAAVDRNVFSPGPAISLTPPFDRD